MVWSLASAAHLLLVAVRHVVCVTKLEHLGEGPVGLVLRRIYEHRLPFSSPTGTVVRLGIEVVVERTVDGCNYFSAVFELLACGFSVQFLNHSRNGVIGRKAHLLLCHWKDLSLLFFG